MDWFRGAIAYGTVPSYLRSRDLERYRGRITHSASESTSILSSKSNVKSHHAQRGRPVITEPEISLTEDVEFYQKRSFTSEK